MGNLWRQCRGKGKLRSDEVRWLGRRFLKLDTDRSGSLSLKEFLAIPSLSKNPLAKRIVEIFDNDGSGDVDFLEFLEGISTFSRQGRPDKKLKFAFTVFDKDRDGYITSSELFDVTKLMVGSNLKDIQLQQAVDKTIMFNDHDGDGRISFNEFCKALGPVLVEDLDQNLNIFGCKNS